MSTVQQTTIEIERHSGDRATFVARDSETGQAATGNTKVTAMLALAAEMRGQPAIADIFSDLEKLNDLLHILTELRDVEELFNELSMDELQSALDSMAPPRLSEAAQRDMAESERAFERGDSVRLNDA